MNDDTFRVTLDVAQFLAVSGVVWGLARMASSLEHLRSTTAENTEAIRGFVASLSGVIGRLMVLEDRDKRG